MFADLVRHIASALGAFLRFRLGRFLPFGSFCFFATRAALKHARSDLGAGLAIVRDLDGAVDASGGQEDLDVEDRFGQSGSYQALREHYGLSAESIATAAIEVMKLKENTPKTLNNPFTYRFME